MPKITPFLWFDGNAEQAVEHYRAIFPDSRVHQVARWGKGAPAPEGSVMSVTFELCGQRVMALNGGPAHRLTPAFSFFVAVDTQEEIDRIWKHFLDGGGKETACGWLDDRFGLSWQIIPQALMELMGDPDPKKAGRVAQALSRMKKIDIAALRRAHAGTEGETP